MIGQGDKVTYHISITCAYNGNFSDVFKETFFARFEGGRVAEHVNLCGCMTDRRTVPHLLWNSFGNGGLH